MTAAEFERAWANGRRNFTGETFEGKAPFVTAYESIGGWKTMVVWYNPKYADGFQEPFEKLGGPYPTEAEARTAAKEQSIRHGLRFQS